MPEIRTKFKSINGLLPNNRGMGLLVRDNKISVEEVEKKDPNTTITLNNEAFVSKPIPKQTVMKRFEPAYPVTGILDNIHMPRAYKKPKKRNNIVLEM